MRKITTAQRLRYMFDNTMSRGPIALIGWLGVLMLILMIISTVLIILFNDFPLRDDGTPFGPLEVVWLSLMHAMDAGALGGDDVRSGFIFLLSMTLVTFGGIFVFSTLIGVLSSGIDSKLEDLRKGRSFVVEKDHVIILGWSTQVFSIIQELVLANENRKDGVVVILAEMDKVEMEDEIRGRVPDLKTTRVVTRTGSPIDLTDLEIVNPNSSRAIIIISEEAHDPDTHVIKTMLALLNSPRRRREPYHIIAEIRDPVNLEVARMVGRDEAQLLLVGDLISRIAVQTCRQSGLSVVYTELLNFGGDEIYFQNQPEFAGKTFGETLFQYEESSIIGVIRQDGRILLNPPMDTILEPNDEMIVISEDDDTVIYAPKNDYRINTDALQPIVEVEETPEHTLILGWNTNGPTVVNKMDQYVAPGSELVVVADVAEAEAQIAERCAACRNQKVTFRYGNTNDRATLDSLSFDRFDHIITMSYSDELGIQEADARTLITLLHLRDITDKTGAQFSIVSEILDSRNRELADVTRADDFIVSDNLISLMLSQVAENRDLMRVFDELFDPEGSELYLQSSTDYVKPGMAVNFYTILEAARRRSQTAIGYRLLRESADPEKNYGIYVNPRKSDQITFTEDDRIIVLADDA